MAPRQAPIGNNNTQINQYEVKEFPIAQQAITKCIDGKLEEIIAGNEAVTVWYIINNNLTSVRLPLSYALRIKPAANAFCYDYFDVTLNS